MSSFIKLFKQSSRPKILAMIHVKALPGSPLYGGSMDVIVKKACQEATIYRDIGVDAVILENMFDVPWQRRVSSATVAAMAAVAVNVKCVLDARSGYSTRMGVQLLAASNVEALAVANSSGGDFIRVEGFVYAHIADKGIVDACAAELLRERRHLAAEHVHILTDVKKKHSSHYVTSDISLAETAKSAELFLSDGVIVTGTSTGVSTNTEHIEEVKEAVNIPVIVGSGVDIDNLGNYKDVDAIIIGSSLKVDGHWRNDVCEDRVASFMEKVQEL